jgi:hypothetical protein
LSSRAQKALSPIADEPLSKQSESRLDRCIDLVNRALSSTLGPSRFWPPRTAQSMFAIAVGHAAIDMKSWTRESQQFTLEE